MLQTQPSPTLYFLAKLSLFVVLALQFVLTTVQFVLFLVDWAIHSAHSSLEPLRYYLALFSERERYAPEQMAYMEQALFQYRAVRWWRVAMIKVLAGLTYGGSRAGAKLGEWGVPIGLPAWDGGWRRPALAPREFRLE